MNRHNQARPFALISITATLLLAACGPAYQPLGSPSKACQSISETQFKAAKEAGATRAEARISEGGGVSMSIGMGGKQCSKKIAGSQVCRRPNDFVIQYTLATGRVVYVKVPEKTDYRLTTTRKPIPCEIIIKD